MNNDPKLEIFRQIFTARVIVLSTLGASLSSKPDAANQLKTAGQEFQDVLQSLERGEVEDQYKFFSEATMVFASLAIWKKAIRFAEPDADRFLRSAQLQISEILDGKTQPLPEVLLSFLKQAKCVSAVSELQPLQDSLLSWPLPLLVFAKTITDTFFGLPVPSLSKLKDDDTTQNETTIAFVRFDIDGKPASKLNYLIPRTAYDLSIELRVSTWPEGANNLSLLPVSVGGEQRDWLPKFRFPKPVDKDLMTFTATGRAMLEVAHSFGSRPYEFLYAAEFDDESNCKEVKVVGHRKLRLEGSDSKSNPLTGFSNVDEHLRQIRDSLRSHPGLPPNDVSNVMTILCGLGGMAAHSLRSGTFEVNTSEREFQKKASEFLRMRSDIGEQLHGHPEAAGGITDLVFRGIPIELKVEKKAVLFAEDFKQFFDQTAAYALGLGKKIGVLSVLETSQKSGPVGIVENDIAFFPHQTGQGFVAIIVVVIRGGFPSPSSYSK